MLKTPPVTQCIPMAKPQIVKAIRLSAKKLGRNPSLRDLRLLGGVSEQVLYRRFGGLGRALAAAGLEATGPGFSLPESTLLLDSAAVARKLGKVPSVHEYESAGRFSNMPFHTRYRHWTRIPEAFRRFARQAKLERDWQDVLKLGDAKVTNQRKAAKAFVHPRVRKGPIHRDRPAYGRPLLLPELAHEPVNELGVVFVFGMLARRLGFVVSASSPISLIAKPCSRWPAACGSASALSLNLRAATSSGIATEKTAVT